MNHDYAQELLVLFGVYSDEKVAHLLSDCGNCDVGVFHYDDIFSGFIAWLISKEGAALNAKAKAINERDSSEHLHPSETPETLEGHRE